MFNFCKISFKRGTDVILKTIKHKLAGLSLYQTLHCLDLIISTNDFLTSTFNASISYSLLIFNKIQQSCEDGSCIVTTKLYSRQYRREFIPLAAVCTDGISSLMFKTSGHLDSIV